MSIKTFPGFTTDFDFTGLNEDFYKLPSWFGTKESALKYKSLKERLSSRVIKYDLIKTDGEYYKKAIQYLTRVAFSIFFYITKEKQPNIVFNLNSTDCFCGLDENIVQIGCKWLTMDNLGRQIKVDFLEAVIYHELYHKLRTVADFKDILFGANKEGDWYKSSNTFIKKILPSEIHKNIHNILEDKRIEKLGADDFPGYTFSFDELRKVAFFLRSEQIFEPSKQPFILIDFLSIKTAIPELRESFINQILEYRKILDENKVKKLSVEKKKMCLDELDTIIKIVNEINDFCDSNHHLVYSDKCKDILEATNKIVDLLPKELQEKLEEGMKKQKFLLPVDFLSGKLPSEGNMISFNDKLSDELQTIIAETIDECKKEMDEQRKTKKEKIKSADENSPFNTITIVEEAKQPIDKKMLREARRMSKSIFNTFGFLDSKYARFDENYEQTEGELDESELYSIKFNRAIFKDIEPIPDYSLDFGILIDESGSMEGKEIDDAKTATLALILALKNNKKINLFVYGHTESGREISLYKYINTLHKVPDYERLFSAKSRWSNADGYAIQKMGEIMQESGSNNKILCVVSDGQPNASGYGGASAISHVRSVVKQLEKKGIMVIQICVNYIKNSPEMFTHYVQYDPKGDFFKNIRKILLKKLKEFSDI